MGRLRGRFDVALYSARVAPLLVPGAGRATGGAETQTVLLARQLAARGLRVAIACERPSYPLPSTLDGITIVSHPAFRRGQPAHPLRNLASMARMLLPVRTRSIVQTAPGSTTLYVALLAKLRRWRFIYWPAGSSDFEYERYAASPRAAHAFHRGVAMSDGIVVMNGEMRELCERAFGRAATVIPAIAEPAEARTGTPEFFLWIGRLDPIKRPHDYIELAQRLPELPFKMIAAPHGEKAPAMRPGFERAVAETPNLELLEPRPREELWPLVERAVAIVNTSEREGVPNAFLEGWARGVPALALHHDPDGVIARERLGGFAAGSPEEFARLAEAMWTSRTDQGELAERCIGYVRAKHSAEVVAARWEGVLRGAGGAEGV